ncbi:MAG: class I SAM-dependent methyltransferase [Candidatus Woesearchaeota archaeon]
MDYYDSIASGYDELHKEEQLKKIALIDKAEIVTESDRLLDVGCGTGFSLDHFPVKEAVGIDPSQGLISQYEGEQKIMQGYAENLPFDDHSFDVVISLTAIQNFDDIEKGLLEMKRVGKDRFALTILKRSPSTNLTRAFVKEIFEDYTVEELDEEKDIIFLIRKE